MMTQKISVIIPFHKEIELIERCVVSVCSELDDSYDYEVIICNDGDFDESFIMSRVEGICGNVKVVPNVCSKGPGGARNTALNISQGNLIAFLDADDVWLPGKVVAQLAAIDRGATFVAAAYRFDSSHTVVQPPASIDNALDIFLHRGIGTSTVLTTRGLVSGQRFRDIRFGQDIDFWYALARSPHFRYAAVDVCYVVYNTGGSTKNKWVQLQYFHKVLRINEVPLLLHVRVLSSYILVGIYNHFIKRMFSRT